jgi:Ca2+-binding RTX toxin-like protein
MRLPLRAWTRTLTALGYTTQPKRHYKKRFDFRHSLLEPLEVRQLLTATVDITSFTTSNNAWNVQYNVSNSINPSTFNIGFYASTDGTTLGTELAHQQVTVSNGTGLAVTGVTPFSDNPDLSTDYYLVAAADTGSSNVELFAGGAFKPSGTGSGPVYLFGTPGNDSYSTVTNPGSTVFTLAGASFNKAQTTEIHVRLGDGNDSFTSSTILGKNLLVFGGAGNDTITGGSGANTLYGGAGNDTITGGSGANTLYGGAGNDTLTGGGTTNILDGGTGNDTLIGEGTTTYVFSSADLNDGSGATTLGSDSVTPGGSDGDTLDFSGLSSGITADLSAASPTAAVTSSDGSGLVNVTLSSGSAIKYIQGTSYADTISGNNLADTIWGNGGGDTINVGVGNSLGSQAGPVTVHGGSGATLNVNDQNTSSGTTYTVTNSSVSRGSLAVNYDGFSQVNLNAGGGADTINVQSTAVSTAIYGDGGNDTFNVSSNAPTDSGNLSGLAGALTVDGGTGSNTLNVSESGLGSGSPDTVLLTND